jgi:hypothetical protein
MHVYSVEIPTVGDVCGHAASSEPSSLYCNCFGCGFGVGVDGGRGEASGLELGAMAGEGGGGMELLGVPRAGRVVGAIIGVEAGFAKALGFLWNSRSFAEEMRSLTIIVVGSGTLSSRASYLCALVERC